MKNIILGLLLSAGLSNAIELGKVPDLVTLEAKDGGKLDGTAWESSMLQGKIYTLFYVDPDERELNTPLADALKAKNFDRKKVNSVAILVSGSMFRA